MSAGDPPAALHLLMDDRDLDDAELWAVIDSAAASGSRKPLLALKNSNVIVPRPSPTPLKPFRNPRIARVVSEVEEEVDIRVSPDGEVVQGEHWASYRRPQKMPRFADSGSLHEHKMVVVRNAPRTPIVAVSSPAYGSSDSGRLVVKDVSPMVESPPPGGWLSEEKEHMEHSLCGWFPSVSSFKEYQNAAMAILEKTDYTMISGSPFIKKSGWRKISFFFNLSFEIKDKSIEFDENRNVQRAEFVVRAYMQGGRFSDGWGSCERREKRFLKPNHDIPSTAETRAKNKACQDLLGIGEYRSGAATALNRRNSCCT